MISLLFATALAAQALKPAINLKCPVLGNPTDARSQTVTVRGRSYRICCGGCQSRIQANPDTYLDKDGAPRNVQ